MLYLKQKQGELFVLPGVLLALVLAVMKWSGDVHGLFVSSIWYDKIMHVGGGAGACALAFWAVANLSTHRKWSILRFGLPIVGVVSGLFFGFIWEIAEWRFPVMVAYIPQGGWDTTFDIVFDCIGGYIAGKKYHKVWRWQS